MVFKDKPFMVSQYTIEQTLAALQELFATDPSSNVGYLYLGICQVLTAILAYHRSRLQGRFHLLIGILQQLTAHLFSDGQVGVREARSLAKLLESFCSPPALRYRKGNKPSELVDEAKKAQAHAGQFAQYLLHFYCSCVLTGSLGEVVREALLPGLWAMIAAMEGYNEDGVKVLSAAANSSERAVLRSVYEDWKRFGRWEGV
jgi:nucleolar pre-ribosomal-associated protein 2